MYAKKAQNYAKYRPTYVHQAFDALEAASGLDAAWSVADIGSGTGNATCHLVDRVHRVFAVEPCAAMRGEAERLLWDHPAFVSVAGAAEKTGLAAHSVDLIVVGQAIHWFNPAPALCEFARILRPGGWLAILWNRFGNDTLDPDTSAYLEDAAVSRFSFSTVVWESWEQFLGGARTAAAAPEPGDPEWEAFEASRRRFFDAHAVGGMIELPYSTELRVGPLRSGQRDGDTVSEVF